ncbi:hypothetical protein [Kistimonas asteriae]|uniref:hypothetical protein n=1 Tax=Kistimonas asteriae TaxID=517724 RepID=UPI001BA855B4|nr:hypothetical protein [Kistimonas asteriae]
MSQFLSSSWWSQVQQTIADADNLKIPTNIRAICLNITVITLGGHKLSLAMKNGLFVARHQPDATAHITLPLDVARRVFIENDTTAGFKAFIRGQLKASGDLRCLLTLHTAQPTPAQRRLQQAIAAFTD